MSRARLNPALRPTESMALFVPLVPGEFGNTRTLVLVDLEALVPRHDGLQVPTRAVVGYLWLWPKGKSLTQWTSGHLAAARGYGPLMLFAASAMYGCVCPSNHQTPFAAQLWARRKHDCLCVDETGFEQMFGPLSTLLARADAVIEHEGRALDARVLRAGEQFFHDYYNGLDESLATPPWTPWQLWKQQARRAAANPRVSR